MYWVLIMQQVFFNSQRTSNVGFDVSLNQLFNKGIWGWDKMSAIFQTTFSWIQCIDFDWYFTEGQIDNIPSLVQTMAWRQPGDKSLSEPMVFSWLMHTYCASQGLNELTKHVRTYVDCESNIFVNKAHTHVESNVSVSKTHITNIMHKNCQRKIQAD